MRKNKLGLGCFDQVLAGFGASKKVIKFREFWYVCGPAGLGKWWKHGLKC